MKLVSRKEDSLQLSLTVKELLTLLHALNDVCYAGVAIKKGEFESRIGVTHPEAEAILEELSAIQKSLKTHG